MSSSSRPIGEVERIDGLTPAAISCPDSVDAVAEALRTASAGKRKVLPCGQRTRMHSGSPPASVDLLLSSARLSGVVHYEPDDLTVTVGAGCTLRDIGELLHTKGQFLPAQSRRGRGTIGGLLADAPEGGTALGYGPVRDYVTGLKAVLADGSVVKAGGRVVKNVAGYPLHRLMVGSYGTLGVIVEASLRVQPEPEDRASVVVGFASPAQAFRAAHAIEESGIDPSFANVLLVDGATRLAVGFDGLARRVAAHAEKVTSLVSHHAPLWIEVLRGEAQDHLRCSLDDPCGPDAGAEGTSSRSAPWAASAAGPALTAGLGGSSPIYPAAGSPPSGEPVSPAHSGPSGAAPGDATNQASRAEAQANRATIKVMALLTNLEALVDRIGSTARQAALAVRIDARPALGSAFCTLKAADRETLHAGLRAALVVARAGGHAIVIDAHHGLRSGIDPWGPPASDFPIMQRIKAALDPAGLFVPGRFVGGL